MMDTQAKVNKRKGNFSDDEWKELKQMDALQKRIDRKRIKENQTEEEKEQSRTNERLRKRLQRQKQKLKENNSQPGT